MKYLLVLLWTLVNLVHAAEVIPIKPIIDCFTCSSDSSMSMYWKGVNSKALIIFIPGGDGNVGLKEGQTNHNHFIRALSNPKITSGQFDAVFLDSPRPLSPNQAYPAARGSMDHLIRIESAIRYYKEKTGLPIWLMGHSNGGISLTEFVKYAQKNNKLDLLSGIVASGIQNASDFDPPISFPMLFMHHRKDGCQYTISTNSYKTFLKVRQFNTMPTEFVYIENGDEKNGDPCSSGFHMYAGAVDEAVKNIDRFMSQFYK